MPGPVLGNCIWCGHAIAYARPGSPPNDVLVDETEMYDRINVWRDYSLVDVPYNYGKFCPVRAQQQPHPLGQYQLHQLIPGREGGQ